MKKVLVVAPHPDDETLGCGGTLLKHRHLGDEIHWVVVTSMGKTSGYSPARRKARVAEIREVARRYDFASVHSLGFPTTTLDARPLGEVIRKLEGAFAKVEPDQVYLPFPGDAHSDHRISFEAAAACAKWFRRPSLRRALCYETLSETEAGLRPDVVGFQPNVFIDIEDFLEEKIEILKTYAGEIGEFPFPRSEEAVRALAMLRGAASGCAAAESFMLLQSRD